MILYLDSEIDFVTYVFQQKFTTVKRSCNLFHQLANSVYKLIFAIEQLYTYCFLDFKNYLLLFIWMNLLLQLYYGWKQKLFGLYRGAKQDNKKPLKK